MSWGPSSLHGTTPESCAGLTSKIVPRILPKQLRLGARHGARFGQPWPNVTQRGASRPCRVWRACRFHDLRHHADTELAESQASDMPIGRLPGTSAGKRLNTIPTSGWQPSGALWMPSLQSRQSSKSSGVRGRARHKWRLGGGADFRILQVVEKLAGTTGLEPATSCVTGSIG